MHSRRRGVMGAVVLVALANGCSAPTEGARSNVQAIYGGVNDNEHINVVGIAILTPQGAATCTGSLIAPNLVLTARHCVSPIYNDERGIVCQTFTDGSGTHQATTAGDPYPARNFYVTTEEIMPSNQTSYVGVAQVMVPPNTTGVPFCGKDIALLRLRTPITSVSPLQPRLDIRPEVTEEFTASGYGATGSTGAGAGRRRMRSGLTTDYLGPLYAAGGILVVTDHEWVGNEGTCQGDSGGPALDQAGWVYGVLSRGPSDCSSPVYTRVDSWRDWIREMAIGAASAAGLPQPEWATPAQPHTAAFGDDCRSDDQCGDNQSCLIIGDRRRCSSVDCAACPAGWICGDAHGYTACIPDPNYVPPPAPEDAGTTPGNDAGGSSMNPLTQQGDGGTTGASRGGCTASPVGARCSLSAAAIAFALAVSLSGRTRRRR